ncbi:MAG: helix-turn-helix transcriptional regulator [Coriobacteriales bacterium]|nr:helix-turn-helix transcriptional regulator [Coriobacteriales bacterium]
MKIEEKEGSSGVVTNPTVLNMGVESSELIKLVLGLACTIIISEASRFSGLYQIGAPEGLDTLIAVAPVLALVTLLLIYRSWPLFRLSRPAASIAVALLLAVSFSVCFGGTQLPVESLPALTITMDCIYRITVVLMIIAWIERLLPLGAKRSLLVYALALIVYGLANGVLLLMQPAASMGIIALTPIISVILMLTLRHPSSSDDEVDTAAGGPRIAASLNGNKGMALAMGLGMSIFCSVFIFAGIHYAWLPLQDGGLHSLGIQMYAALGTAICGALLFFLVRNAWSRNSLDASRILILVFMLLAMYLASRTTAGQAVFVIPLNIAQKICLALLFLCPFWYENMREPLLFAVGCFLVYRFAQLASSIHGYSPFIYDAIMFCCLALLLLQSIGIVFALSASPRNEAAAEPKDLPVTPELPFLQATAPSVEVSERTPKTRTPGAYPPPAAMDSELRDIQAEYNLTNKELEILDMLARGHTTTYICEALFISMNTIKTHRRNIYAKLGIHSQQELQELIASRRS